MYCEDCNIAAVRRPDKTVNAPSPDELVGVRPWAIDADGAMDLWALSEKMLGQRFQF